MIREVISTVLSVTVELVFLFSRKIGLVLLLAGLQTTSKLLADVPSGSRERSEGVSTVLSGTVETVSLFPQKK